MDTFSRRAMGSGNMSHWTIDTKTRVTHPELFSSLKSRRFCNCTQSMLLSIARPSKPNDYDGQFNDDS